MADTGQLLSALMDFRVSISLVGWALIVASVYVLFSVKTFDATLEHVVHAIQ